MRHILVALQSCLFIQVKPIICLIDLNQLNPRIFGKFKIPYPVVKSISSSFG
tara:strand:+ start:2556 stop:2711 length:156 start_codon:yes stop_codon:yes gene_type:complete